MPQFTPPQDAMGPLIQSLIQDKLRQQQFERAQNARIQQEQRAAQQKMAQDTHKRQLDLIMKVAEAGGDVSGAFSPQGIDSAALLQELSRIGQVGRQKEQQEVLEPLAEPLANLVGGASNLQQRALSGAGFGPEQNAQIRNIARAAGALTPQAPVTFSSAGKAIFDSRSPAAAPGSGTAIGQMAMQEFAKREQAEVELGQREAVAARASGKEIKSLNRDVRSARRNLQAITKEFGVQSPQFAQGLEEYRTLEMRRNRAAAGSGRTITVGPEGGVSIEEGGIQAARMDLRATDSINHLDNLLSDITWIRETIQKDPNLTGFTGGLQGVFNTAAGIAGDLARSDIALGTIVDPQYAAELERQIMGDGEIQGLKLIQMRLAYAWVRANRGNGRITQKELESAMERFRLVGGLRSSKDVHDTVRMLERHVRRDRRQARDKFKKGLGIQIDDTAFEPVPPAGATSPARRGMRPEVESLADDLLGGP